MKLNPSTVAERIALLSWVLPLAFSGLIVLYQMGPARWVHDTYSAPVHFVVEILFYGTVGPLLILWTLRRLGGWLHQKEQAERQARASDRHLAVITNASADAIVGIDSHGCVESWNRGATLLFGYTAGNIVGLPFALLFGCDSAAGAEFGWLAATVYQTGFVRGYETTCFGSDGQPIIVELTATHLAGDEGGQFLGMSVILRNITQRKRREEEIRRLNANLNEQVEERTRELAEKVEELARANASLQKLDQTRSEFISLVSHQIRAPLTNIQGAVERMRTDCYTINPTCVRMSSIVEQQTVRLDRLVRDVLNAARIETGDLVLHPEPISVLPVVQQAVEQMVARMVDRPFHVPTKPGLPLVFADRDRVVEVLANLLDNADKYSLPGATISLDVWADDIEVTIAVQDAGSGLPSGDLERVFDKFYRADNSDAQAVYGYGLGLYVCRRLVEAQGGRIWADNHPKGAVFSFTLPVWQEDSNAYNSGH